MGVIEGLRTYLCVRNGFAAELLLGSRSTVHSGGWGGHKGRALKAGDVLRETGASGQIPSSKGRSLNLERMYAAKTHHLRVLRGPQWAEFSPRAQADFFESTFEVSLEANRLGLRLVGPQLELAQSHRDLEMISEGWLKVRCKSRLQGRP